MDLTEYLEKTYNDCSNPCFVMDYDSEELLFINQSLQKKFQVFQDFKGRKTDELFKGFLNPEDLCPKTRAISGDYHEKRIYSTGLQTHLRANTTLLFHGERKLLLTKFFMTSVDKKRIDAGKSFEEAMAQCSKILTIPQKETCIQGLLDLLCQFYGSESAFIWEFSLEKKESHFCWNHGQHQDESTLPTDQFLHWLETNNKRRELLSLDICQWEQRPDSIQYQILSSFDVSNLTVHSIFDKNDNIIGVVTLANRSQPLYDDRLLTAITHFATERYNEVNSLKILDSLNELDLLTGFYNRNKYVQTLAQLQVNPPKSLGVLFINLNGLRKTNEYFGFEVGDVQLKKTSDILREYFQEDFFRISGDEFVAFMPNWDKVDFNKKVDELHVRLKSANNEVNFSLGHSWETGHYHVGNLVKVADTVMMINKQAFYFNTLHENEDILDTILRDLFRALAEDEFLVYLQPQINLDTEEVVGAEALIRRYDRKHQKMVFPDTFIPLYEKNSIIRHVDLFVIRKVCQILGDWMQHDQIMPISVNLSRVTLMEHGIVNTITEILDEYHVPHEYIVIEITERIGLVECEVTTSLVDDFKERGFRLSLDDFGCAYSNIVTLSQIEVDEVKIDKSLVDNLVTNSKNRVIVKNMLSMCHELDNTFSLAEGIETEEQAEFLRSVHCHLGQGYLYSRPMPNEEFFQKYIKPHEEADSEINFQI